MDLGEELATFNTDFADALARQDFDRLRECYADDAVFLTQGMVTVVGRDEIVKLMQAPSSGSDVLAFETDHALEGGDLVVDIGRIMRGGEAQARYVVVYRRQPDGSLKLAADVVLPGGRDSR